VAGSLTPFGLHHKSRMETAQANPAEPKLLDQVRNQIRIRHFSIRTEEAYVRWVRRLMLFSGKRHPIAMESEHIAMFFTYLAIVTFRLTHHPSSRLH
jgi:hypothetical protein